MKALYLFFFILCSTNSYAQLAAGLKAGFVASVLSTGTSDESVGGYGFQIAKNLSYGDKDNNLIRAGAELSFSYFEHKGRLNGLSAGASRVFDGSFEFSFINTGAFLLISPLKRGFFFKPAAYISFPIKHHFRGSEITSIKSYDVDYEVITDGNPATVQFGLGYKFKLRESSALLTELAYFHTSKALVNQARVSGLMLSMLWRYDLVIP